MAFNRVLAPGMPWRRSFERIVFAVYDTSEKKATHATFQRILAPPAPPA